MGTAVSNVDLGKAQGMIAKGCRKGTAVSHGLRAAVATGGSPSEGKILMKKRSDSTIPAEFAADPASAPMNADALARRSARKNHRKTEPLGDHAPRIVAGTMSFFLCHRLRDRISAGKSPQAIEAFAEKEKPADLAGFSGY